MSDLLKLLLADTTIALNTEDQCSTATKFISSQIYWVSCATRPAY